MAGYRTPALGPEGIKPVEPFIGPVADQAVIKLYEFEGLGLLVPRRSGVLYVQQAGGHGCAQVAIEGVFAPLETRFYADPSDHLVTSKLMRMFESGWERITKESAARIDDILRSHARTSFIKVDPRYLTESMESWVYVLVAAVSADARLTGADIPGFYTPIITGLGELEAVLTWPNSD